jgi:hypothetical protein
MCAAIQVINIECWRDNNKWGGTTSVPLSVKSENQNSFSRVSFHSHHRIHLIILSTTVPPNQKPVPSQSNRINESTVTKT